jgi:hypothetical protein
MVFVCITFGTSHASVKRMECVCLRLRPSMLKINAKKIKSVAREKESKNLSTWYGNTYNVPCNIRMWMVLCLYSVLSLYYSNYRVLQ